MSGSAEYQYEFDGNRLTRGSLRLGFRSLVPYKFHIGSLSPEIGLFIANEFGVFNRNENPTVTSWTIEAAVLLDLDNPFSHKEIPLKLKATEPFTPAGRTKVQLEITEDKQIECEREYEIVFRVKGSNRPVSSVAPGHSILFTRKRQSNNEEDEEEEEREDFLSCKRLIVPIIPFRPAAPRLLIGESSSNLGIGGKVWDGSIAMLEFLFATSTRWSVDLKLPTQGPIKILDLGSGTGILGCGLALLFPESLVINTDLPDVVPLLAINRGRIKNLREEAYPWGSIPTRNGLIEKSIPFDIIFMCDVVYDETCYAPLLDSIQHIPSRHIMMSHRHRNRSETSFFESLAKIGKLECVKYPIIKQDDPFHNILNFATPADVVIQDKFKANMDDIAVFRITLNNRR